jgi:hypothetical protein
MRHRPHHWRLEGHTPVPVPDDEVLAWAEWFQHADRTVVQEYIGPYFVSTVFLALDHNFSFTGPPILFETMVFGDGGGAVGNYQERCSTWDEALDMHQRGLIWAVAKVAVESI